MADRRPRVLLASGPVRDVSPGEAAIALAAGFADAADVAVIGLAEGGRALAAVLAEPDGEVESLHTGWLVRCADLVAVGTDRSAGSDLTFGTGSAERGLMTGPTGLGHQADSSAGPGRLDAPLTGSSAGLGRLVAYAAQSGQPRTLVVDLTGTDSHDAGAGLLGSLGALADVDLDAGPHALAGLGILDLEPARRRLAGWELVGVVPPGEQRDLLLGLRGVTSRRGRQLGISAERMLAMDSALERFVRTGAPDLAQAEGAGAAGGLGFAILALGGRLSPGPAFCADRSRLDRAIGPADLVVTGCDSFDFGSRGGAVVGELATRCEAAETPLVVVSPVVGMSGREMRVMGVESAHPVDPGPDLARALTTTARRLAGGWTARW